MLSRLRLSVSTLITVVKKCEEIARRCVQCGPLSKKRKLLKHSPLEELECSLSAWFKQARENNASTDGTHFNSKDFHITVCLGIANFSASEGWIDRFKRRHNVLHRTISGESKC
jgi:centromere protein B